MSLDNVLAVAAAARGHLALLAFGLVLSMALMMLAGTAVASLLNRWAWLSYVGAAAIAWTGTDMALRDPAIAAALAPTDWVIQALPVVAAGLTLLAARWWHARRNCPAAAP
jgi:predicted tellurium resistance membrane protein TerC